MRSRYIYIYASAQCWTAQRASHLLGAATASRNSVDPSARARGRVDLVTFGNLHGASEAGFKSSVGKHSVHYRCIGGKVLKS